MFGTWFVNIPLAWTVQIIQHQLKEQLYCSVVCACAQFREQICEVEVCPKWSRQLAVHTNGFCPPGRGLTAPGDWKIKREVSTYCLITLCKIFSLWEKEIVCGCLSGKTDHLSLWCQGLLPSWTLYTLVLFMKMLPRLVMVSLLHFYVVLSLFLHLFQDYETHPS